MFWMCRLWVDGTAPMLTPSVLVRNSRPKTVLKGFTLALLGGVVSCRQFNFRSCRAGRGGGGDGLLVILLVASQACLDDILHVRSSCPRGLLAKLLSLILMIYFMHGKTMSLTMLTGFFLGFLKRVLASFVWFYVIFVLDTCLLWKNNLKFPLGL
ncbi:unnamed protein product [Polarella glacialis]|uniref:Uncharacterized protein n=1 Tax=Polarella glacialis TaxID=89957 RepID=A0A813KZE6_POLGL|nr:unnamed protein product [Polarella glacialis]|mmetsp:Transcript_38365/g.69529  ORF Transcript_38365/g.69529 Transcript_38365/m.69529 type:complete len:155 (-) Transcript_38365:616-1080(-)